MAKNVSGTNLQVASVHLASGTLPARQQLHAPSPQHWSLPPTRASEIASQLRFEPCGRPMVLRFSPPIGVIAGWVHGSEDGVQLKRSMHKDWARRHFTLMEGDCPPTLDSQKLTLWVKQRVCLCLFWGKNVYKTHVVVQRLLKAAFPVGEQRRALTEGFAFLQLSRVSRERA